MSGRSVTIVGKDVDRYGRLVARVTVDNVDASESIIAAGMDYVPAVCWSESRCSMRLRTARAARNEDSGPLGSRSPRASHVGPDCNAPHLEPPRRRRKREQQGLSPALVPECELQELHSSLCDADRGRGRRLQASGRLHPLIEVDRSAALIRRYMLRAVCLAEAHASASTRE